MLPGSAELVAHPATRLLVGDFFALAAGDGVDPVRIAYTQRPRDLPVTPSAAAADRAGRT